MRPWISGACSRGAKYGYILKIHEKKGFFVQMLYILISAAQAGKPNLLANKYLLSSSKALGQYCIIILRGVL
jgi:hypothetical protein